MAAKVAGSLRAVSTLKKPRTNTQSAIALPTDAIVYRSTRLPMTSTPAAVINSPEWTPRFVWRPKNGGNWPSPASERVNPPEPSASR